MIPFIIGGIALTATGYGVAKLLEDECNCDKKSDSYFVDLDNEKNDPKIDELIEKFELAKLELYNTSFIELKMALSEIENLDKEITITTLKLEEAIYSFKELTDDIKQNFEKYTDILYKTKDYINFKLDYLDSIIVNESNYEKYNKEDKELVDELIKSFILIDKIAISEISNDKLDISRKVKSGFTKIEKIINTSDIN